MNADGSNPVDITNNEAKEEGPAWSPDGTKIVFAREQKTKGNYDIYVMNADGTNQINLTNSSAQATGPVWSPDGKRLPSTGTEAMTSTYGS
jgi:Tol biopolymer transport system component